MKQLLTRRLHASCAVVGCNGDWTIDHIEPGSTVHWSCHDCGTPHDLKRIDDLHADVTIADRPMRRRKLVLLEIAPQAEPIRLVIRSEWTDGQDHQPYYYDEGTCPVNWAGDVVGIALGDDDDPTFVAMVDDTSKGEYHALKGATGALLEMKR